MRSDRELSNRSNADLPAVARAVAPGLKQRGPRPFRATFAHASLLKLPDSTTPFPPHSLTKAFAAATSVRECGVRREPAVALDTNARSRRARADKPHSSRTVRDIARCRFECSLQLSGFEGTHR